MWVTCQYRLADQLYFIVTQGPKLMVVLFQHMWSKALQQEMCQIAEWLFKSYLEIYTRQSSLHSTDYVVKTNLRKPGNIMLSCAIIVRRPFWYLKQHRRILGEKECMYNLYGENYIIVWKAVIVLIIVANIFFNVFDGLFWGSSFRFIEKWKV